MAVGRGLLGCSKNPCRRCIGFYDCGCGLLLVLAGVGRTASGLFVRSLRLAFERLDLFLGLGAELDDFGVDPVALIGSVLSGRRLQVFGLLCSLGNEALSVELGIAQGRLSRLLRSRCLCKQCLRLGSGIAHLGVYLETKLGRIIIGEGADPLGRLICFGTNSC